jgi:methionyl-tRNA formyltransferase
LRVIFFGTSEFGVPALRKLREQADVVTVVTTKEMPRGRGLTVQASPIKTCALELGLPVLEPENPNAPESVAQLRALAPELIVLAAYRFILKSELLAISPLGCLNLHPSLLPRYRGAAPIQRALMNGETLTGVSLFLMNEKIDQGDVIMQGQVEIGLNDNAGEVSARLADLSARLLEQALPEIEKNDYSRLAQDPTQASYAAKIRKEERLIDWRLGARQIHNLVRALAPAPAAYSLLRGQRLELTATELQEDRSGQPGELTVDGRHLFCGAGQGSLVLLQVKPEGGRLMTGADLINGRRIKSGEMLTAGGR